MNYVCYVLLDVKGKRVYLPYCLLPITAPTHGVMAQAVTELVVEHIHHLMGI
ncbi:MAG: hypothetical protein ACSLEM_01575 [Candidatus Malihini olakiniferum]